MTAQIASTYTVGSRMNVRLELSLETGFNVRRDFEAIVRMVNSAARFRVRDWVSDHWDVQVSIVVFADRQGTDDDLNMVSNAVCKGIDQLPGGTIHWQVIGGK